MTKVKSDTLTLYSFLPGLFLRWKKSLSFSLTIKSAWDWDTPIWFVRSEWIVDGDELKIDVAVMDNYMIFGFPIAVKSTNAKQVYAKIVRTLDCRMGSRLTVLAWAMPPGASEPFAFRVSFCAETMELEILEDDPRDRPKFLKLMDSILQPGS